jgi:serine/threonine protein phosphatase PrpC
MLKLIDCHGLSEVGRTRKVNDDQFLIADLNKSLRVHQTSLGLDEQARLFGGSQGKLLAVADGMGGYAGGERASSIAVDAIVHYILNHMRWFFRVDKAAADDLLADLVAALKHCQTAIRADAKALPTHRDAGTTITLAYVVWPDLYVVHVGDSRCYLLRDGQLEQLTTDHAVAHHGGDSRLIDPQAAEPSRWNHMLWNVLNAREEESKSDGCRVELKLGDTLLLCTDGLTKHLAADEVVRLLSRDQGARDACRTLVDAAMHRGGRDNITVVVAQFQDVDTKLDKPNRAERLLKPVIY